MMNKGFTLIELMTAVAIFTIVMFVSLGSILGVFDANRKTKSMKVVMNNLNLAIETMSKEMRYGENYHCGSGGDPNLPQNCAGGDTYLGFLSSDGVQIAYRLSGTVIEKRVGNDNFLAVTSPEAVIENLTFYALGAGLADSLQPKVILRINGYAGSGKNRSDFTLQTMISQRVIDR